VLEIGHASKSGASFTLSAMPIYEYRCAACSERFEELVRRAEDPVACPECGGAQAERLISTFAGIGTGGSAPMPDYARLGPRPAAGGCCGGACGHVH
jgi:putative FmdB family regulatory protein